jgi:hypothetical protein
MCKTLRAKKMMLGIALACVSAAVFGQPEFKISVGAGLLGYDNYVAQKIKLKDDYLFENSGGASESASISDTSYFGGFVFIDATYAEGSVYYAGSNSVGKEKNLGFAVYLKYPFELRHITIFPLLGVRYDTVLEMEDTFGNNYGSRWNSAYFCDNGTPTDDKVELSDLNTLCYCLGLGGDVFFSQKVFLRAEYTLGIVPVLNNYYKNLREEGLPSDIAEFEYFINYNQTVRFALGCRF